MSPLPRAFRHGAVHCNGAATGESFFFASGAGAGRRGATGQVETELARALAV